MTTLPPRRNWEDVAARLRQFTDRPGLCVVSLRVVVCDGQPIAWTEPEELRIEPKTDGRKILDLLSG